MFRAELRVRLAKKKARAEAMKREMEAAQRKEEEKLLAKHKVNVLTTNPM